MFGWVKKRWSEGLYAQNVLNVFARGGINQNQVYSFFGGSNKFVAFCTSLRELCEPEEAAELIYGVMTDEIAENLVVKHFEDAGAIPGWSESECK